MTNVLNRVSLCNFRSAATEKSSFHLASNRFRSNLALGGGACAGVFDDSDLTAAAATDAYAQQDSALV